MIHAAGVGVKQATAEAGLQHGVSNIELYDDICLNISFSCISMDCFFVRGKPPKTNPFTQSGRRVAAATTFTSSVSGITSSSYMSFLTVVL